MKMQYVTLEEKKFAYCVHGHIDNSAVVLLHGWPEASRIWAKVIPALAMSHFVIAIDLPGLGESDGIEKYDTGSVSDWTRKIVNSLGVHRFQLISHDIGSCNKAYNTTAISGGDIDFYVEAYKDKLSEGFNYYRSYSQSVLINKELLRKLPMPVLAIGGGHAAGDKMKDVALALSENWQFENIPECGHFVPEEQPDRLLIILNSFLERQAGR